MMKLALALFAGCLFAQAPAITDAQRLKYRETERDYYRARVAMNELQQQVIAQHAAFEQACGAPIDEQTLTCKGQQK